jgi:hypothetical protein
MANLLVTLMDKSVPVERQGGSADRPLRRVTSGRSLSGM